MWSSYLLLLHLQLHLNGLLLVLAALVLEPYSDDSRRQARHLHQLLLHERIRSRISIVAGSERSKLFLKNFQYISNIKIDHSPERMQLFLIEHGPNPRGLAIRWPRGSLVPNTFV